MGTFTDKVWVEYPIPFSVSIWGKVETASLLELVEASVAEVASDIAIVGHMTASRDQNAMPVGCREVLSCKLDLGFQGNRFVRKSYDRETNILYLRMYPALVKYRRDFLLTDVDNLVGDNLIYFKSYVMLKMADKELIILSSVTYDQDNGEVNLTTLKEFKDKCEKKVSELKPELLMYGNSR